MTDDSKSRSRSSVVSILTGGSGDGHTTTTVLEQMKEFDPDMVVFLWEEGRVHHSLCSLPRFEPQRKDILLASASEVLVFVSASSGSLRKELVDKIKQTFKEDVRLKFPSLVHRTAVVSSTATIGDGCVVGPFALVNSCASLGDFCMLEAAALVESDCEVGNYATIGTRAVLLGSVKIESFATVGPNSTVKENLVSVISSNNSILDNTSTNTMVDNTNGEASKPIRWCWQKPFSFKRFEDYLNISLTKGQLTNDGPLQPIVSAKLKTICRCNNNILMASNGTAALHALVTGLTLRHQRPLRWVTQSFTFPSSIQGPLMNSIVCDIDPDLGGPCLQFLEEHLDEFDGVIVTNVFGHQTQIIRYEEWCVAHKKLLVFDNAATPLGFLSDGRSIHDIGDGSIVSLHETKSIGRGEGGAVMTTRETYPFVHKAMNFGYDIPKQIRIPDRLASNWRMSDIPSASLCDYFDLLVSSDYEQRLNTLTLFAVQQLQQRGLDLALPLRLPTILSCLCVRLSVGVDAVSAMKYMNSFGIEAKRYYQPLSSREEAPESWRLYDETLCLPFHIGLSEIDIRRMVNLLPNK